MNWTSFITFIGLFLSSHYFIKGVYCTDDQLNIFSFLKYLDVNILSRLFVYKNYMYGKKHVLRPKFGGSWLYHSKDLTRWTRRLGMYGYGAVAMNSHGNGNCMFYTISSIFRVNNITNEKLLEYLNPDTEPAVEVAIRGLLEGNEYLRALDLKRISQIFWFGCDPFDEESVSLFNRENFMKRLAETTMIQEDEKPMNKELGEMWQDVNMKAFERRIKDGENINQVQRDLWKEFSKNFYSRDADVFDIDHITYTLQLELIMMTRRDTTIICREKMYKFTPKIFMTVLYANGAHFDVFGIFKLGQTEAKDIKTIFTIEELPIPILLFITEDCRLIGTTPNL